VITEAPPANIQVAIELKSDWTERGNPSRIVPSYAVSRFRTLATVVAYQAPPLAVLTPRAFSASAVFALYSR
jgi:hypothetical protein